MDDDRRNSLPVPAEPRGGRPHVAPSPAADEREQPPPEPDPAEQITRLRGERDAHLEMLRRVTAEFDNYRKRMLREQTTHLDRAAEGVLTQLLPVVDAVEIGARHHPEALGPVHEQLQHTLAAEGLHRFDPLGEPFDPAVHEAVAPEEPPTVVPMRRAPEAEAVVAEVLRPGYRVHGHLLRPALVRLAPSPAAE
ncbi:MULTISPECIES: nucleotide exchange factor GrpE [unclassified Saccharopolyspora]|uniref:nucleotide exchange factor GrpE n=2 Tax=Saccharopolyspora TaxID=1835 RepID=UPI001CD4D60A|nr:MULTISPECIES: nucleotide exchange factor GrpE [unclassified Saccharopolyspora]MCA1187162.1 nucleotide exchange factor GrpE [Saccharopolyspora sp. 6T]MCA1193730.1 nucleotide exchange factor GrpE [Saccharopolyspora sp. 6V]